MACNGLSLDNGAGFLTNVPVLRHGMCLLSQTVEEPEQSQVEGFDVDLRLFGNVWSLMARPSPSNLSGAFSPRNSA